MWNATGFLMWIPERHEWWLWTHSNQLNKRHEFRPLADNELWEWGF